MHKHLRQLDRIWLDSPIYFITICTKDRRAVLAQDEVTEILIEESRGAHGRHGWVVCRYVIMPDHVHFFAGQSQVLRSCLNLSGRGKVGQVGRFTRWMGRVSATAASLRLRSGAQSESASPAATTTPKERATLP
jgi:REP element-mobilizing transposase RayT